MSISAQTLFVVALPIGNPLDLSPRARAVLEAVHTIAAEDTRDFERLARHLKLQVRNVVSHHEHNEKPSTDGLLDLLRQGHSIALVTDAGTPAISDPGYPLVSSAMAGGFRVVPVPGPSALTTALSVSPIGGTSHFFGGFAPANEVQFKTLLHSALHLAHKVIFFESAQRLAQQLRWALESDGDRQVAVFRELTKEHEEIKFGPISEALNNYQAHPPKGEVVVLYKGSPGREDLLSETETQDQARELLQQGLSARDTLEALKQKSCLRRQELFDLIQKIKNSL